MAGWVRLRGALQVRPSRLGSRLLVCAFLRTRQDRGWASCPTRPRHASGPCGSRPRNRAHPAFDSFLRPVVDPRHAWMNFHRNRIFRRLNEKHPRMAWIDRVDQGRHLPTAAGICRRWAVWGCRTVGAMDGAIEPPRMGLRRVLQPHTAPPDHRQSRAALALALALALDSALASAGAGRSPAETHPQELQDSIEQPARLSAHAGRLPAKCSSPARSVYGSRSTSCNA